MERPHRRALFALNRNVSPFIIFVIKFYHQQGRVICEVSSPKHIQLVSIPHHTATNPLHVPRSATCWILDQLHLVFVGLHQRSAVHTHKTCCTFTLVSLLNIKAYKVNSWRVFHGNELKKQFLEVYATLIRRKFPLTFKLKEILFWKNFYKTYKNIIYWVILKLKLNLWRWQTFQEYLTCMSILKT